MHPYTLPELLPEFQAYAQWMDELRASRLAREGMPVSRWYYGEGFEAYTRVGPTLVGLRMLNGICLANIEVSEERRGRGFMTHLVSFLCEMGPQWGAQTLKFESVLNERFHAWLRLQGFEATSLSEPLLGSSLARPLASLPP